MCALISWWCFVIETYTRWLCAYDFSATVCAECTTYECTLDVEKINFSSNRLMSHVVGVWFWDVLWQLQSRATKMSMWLLGTQVWLASSRDLGFTYTPRVHPLTECVFLSSRSWSSFTDPVRMEGWVGLSGWLHTNVLYVYTLIISLNNFCEFSIMLRYRKIQLKENIFLAVYVT